MAEDQQAAVPIDDRPRETHTTDGLMVEVGLREEVEKAQLFNIDNLEVLVKHSQKEAALVRRLVGLICNHSTLRHNDLHFSDWEGRLRESGPVLAQNNLPFVIVWLIRRVESEGDDSVVLLVWWDLLFVGKPGSGSDHHVLIITAPADIDDVEARVLILTSQDVKSVFWCDLAHKKTLLASNHELVSAGGIGHSVDVSRLFNLQRVRHSRLIVRESYHIDVAEDLANDQDIPSSVNQSRDVWLLHRDLADLLELLSLVDHDKATIARKRNPFRVRMCCNFVH